MDGWDFCLGMMETCGMSRDMWPNEGDGKEFMRVIIIMRGAFVHKEERNISFFSFIF